MSTILTLHDGSAATLSEAEDLVAEVARKAVRPLYRNKGKRPEHIATSTFVEVDGADYLVTAAHVIDGHEAHTLFVGQKKTIGLTATFHMTVAPGDDRKRDKLDFAFARVDGSWRELGIEPLPLSELPELEDAQFYSAFGFPNSRNKHYNPVKRYVRPTCRQFISVSTQDPEAFKKIGLHPDVHLALTRPTKYGLSERKRVRMFEPRGMSGGMIFGLYGLHRIDVMGGLSKPLIVPEAIITEKSVQHQLLFGTRLVVIVDAIRRECVKAGAG